MKTCVVALILATIFPIGSTSFAAQITAGPMLGHVTESTASVWLRSPRGIVHGAITAEAIQNDLRIPGKLINLRDNMMRFEFEGPQRFGVCKVIGRHARIYS